MNNFFEDLRKYFESTPRKQVLKDWAKSKEFDKVGPTVDEFLENNKNIKNDNTTNNSNNSLPHRANI